MMACGKIWRTRCGRLRATEATANSNYSFYRSEYQRRHALDKSIVKIVFPMATFLMDRDTLRQQLKHDFYWEENHPEGERLIQLFSRCDRLGR
jgi:hypothetical protein